MKKSKICASIVNNDLEVVKEIEPLADLFEVRIDLIGDGWQELALQLKKPWIACNRSASEGGSCNEDESRRIEELLEAAEMGADIIDVELRTKNLKDTINIIKKRAKCLLSFHELERTPPFNEMRGTVQRQLEAGADICKLITTARNFEDNIAVLELISAFPEVRLISFAMGPLGAVSRIFCPLVGGDFTYASISKGQESAPGQITVKELRQIYEKVA
ncbi:type I 3-dehydroquinate dehydratase [Chloroflexota bacterium]